MHRPPTGWNSASPWPTVPRGRWPTTCGRWNASCRILKPFGKKVLVKRLKKILKIGALLLGAFLALWLIGNGISIWVTGSRLEERLAAIRNAGDPVTLADLVRPAPPPDQNAAVLLRRGHAEIDALVKEIHHIEERIPDEKSVMSEAVQKAIRTALEAYPRVLPLLEQAAACPDYNPELPYSAGPGAFMNSFLTEVQQFRSYTNILDAQFRSLRAQGKRDEAVRSCLVNLRLTRRLEREPILISYLVVLACRAVAIGEINAILLAGPISDTVRAE